jgi:hypothetical protein
MRIAGIDRKAANVFALSTGSVLSVLVVARYVMV